MSKKSRQRRHHRRAGLLKEADEVSSVPAPAIPQAGLLVTDEFSKALDHCRLTVKRIAQECRAKNRRYRDIEFDLDNDEPLCLSGLMPSDDDTTYTPTGVSRVSDIFAKPQFFIDGAGSNDIVQGRLGDCWFLSALSTVSTSSAKLIEKFCVSRDEKVGVYGFVFFKNGSWVTVVIDDLLYVHIPKFEELKRTEQILFHSDKRNYNRTARRGGKGLYFARSSTENETWVPLVEKAYAKLHGDYAALEGGTAAEAIEDITGGVSSVILIKDILDFDRFWEEELLKANVDRLFTAALDELSTARNGESSIQVEGLIGGHAYSILKAVEVGGKRFVMLRNPWGNSEWKGPWSDGSREWTSEWLARLPEFGHLFGEDGQFVMEYSDFLKEFEDIDKTLLFDSTWKMSMEWLRVPTRPPLSAWSFGDVSFTFTITQPTKAVIVLSRLDDRYFKGIEEISIHTLQFVVYKLGEDEPLLISESEQPAFDSRSVNTEVLFKPGIYVVQVRIESLKNEALDTSLCLKRKLTRVYTERSISRLVATNYDPQTEEKHIPTLLDTLLEHEQVIQTARAKAEAETAAPESKVASVSSTPIAGDDFVEIKSKNESESGDDRNEKGEESRAKEGGTDGDTKGSEKPKEHEENASTTKSGESDGIKDDERHEVSAPEGKRKKEEPGPHAKSESDSDRDTDSPPSGSTTAKTCSQPPVIVPQTGEEVNINGDSPPSPMVPSGGKADVPEVQPDAYIGLRIYTQGNEKVHIMGRIREVTQALYLSAKSTVEAVNLGEKKA